LAKTGADGIVKNDTARQMDFKKENFMGINSREATFTIAYYIQNSNRLYEIKKKPPALDASGELYQ
jgi:hypothetical protein